MAWLDPIEWAPPADHPGSQPYILWTDTQRLTVLWLDTSGTLCRQDFLVDPTSGSIELAASFYDASQPMFSQHITGARMSPDGFMLIQTTEDSSS